MTHDERCIDRTTCQRMIESRDDAIHSQAKIIADLRVEIARLKADLLTAADRVAICSELLAKRAERGPK